jgi:hypothetical protein
MLDIDVLDLAVEAATTPDRAALLLRRVEDSVGERLAAELETFSDDGDARELFIEQLDVGCDVGAGWDPDAIARALAARLHEELNMVRKREACTVFRDRAEFIAAFVVDALARLTEHEARRVLAALNSADAMRLLDWIGRRSGDSAPPAAQFWAATATLPGMDIDPVRWLVALIDAERATPGAAGGAALALMEAFCTLRERARREPALFATVASDARQTLAQWSVACGVDPRCMQSLDAGAAAAICADLAAAPAAGKASREEVHCTGFGGAFVLSLVLSRLSWIDLWRLAAGSEVDENLIAALAWLVVVKATASPKQLEQALADPALRALLGSTVDPAGVLAPLGQRSSARAIDALTGLAVPPPEDGAEIVLARRGRRASALVEPHGGCVVALRPASTHPASRRLGRRTSPGESEHVRWWTRHWARCETTPGISTELDEALDVASLNLLRELGYRLPGCANASADYLRANLLSCAARVECDGDALRVDLGRPPLDVLLVLSGWKRAECTLPDGRRLSLREASP